MDKIKCIYAIKDKRNDKVIYIGQTKDFNHRKSNHFTTYNRPIDKYMFEQGRYNFEMYIIKEFSNEILDEELLKEEDNLILKYNTIENGFNIKRSGNITFNEDYYKNKQKEHYEEHKKECREKYTKTEEYRAYAREYRRQWRAKNPDKEKEYKRQSRLKKKLESQDK